MAWAVALQHHLQVRRGDIDHPALEFRPVGRMDHREIRGPAQELRQLRRLTRKKMDDDEEGGRQVGGKFRQNGGHRRETTGRGADDDDVSIQPFPESESPES
jgi:hypothetical protein